MHLQAQAAADRGDYEAAEGLWVRAQLPQQALAMLRTARKWPEALAFARAHLPEQACHHGPSPCPSAWMPGNLLHMQIWEVPLCRAVITMSPACRRWNQCDVMQDEILW